MRRIISILLVILILTTTAEATVTERKGRGVERFLWDELSKHSPSDQVTAAVLSYFWRESQYRSDAVAGWASSLHGYGIDLCEKVTERTDKGLEDGSSRDYFLKACRKYGGYGLGQWQSPSKVEALYDFAVGYGGSIGDAELQCAFIFDNLENDHPRLWKKLKKCKSAEKAGRLLAIYYDGTQEGMDYIGYKAKQFYEKYGGDA